MSEKIYRIVEKEGIYTIQYKLKSDPLSYKYEYEKIDIEEFYKIPIGMSFHRTYKIFKFKRFIIKLLLKYIKDFPKTFYIKHKKDVDNTNEWRYLYSTNISNISDEDFSNYIKLNSETDFRDIFKYVRVFNSSEEAYNYFEKDHIEKLKEKIIWKQNFWKNVKNPDDYKKSKTNTKNK